MITTKTIREFSIDCMRWAEEMVNASDKQTVIDAARQWIETANAIERYVASGRGDALPDLREKLN